MTNPRLTIGFSSLADRVGNITLPELPSDVEVLVCIQGGHSGAVAREARVVSVPGVGVARSRNAAIAAAGGRFLLFCDDDVDVQLEGVVAAVEHLERTGHALALGQALDPSGRRRKQYPSRVTPLTRFNSGRAATYEMLIDVQRVRDAGVRFDERFGAGTELHLGDEYIFIADLLRAGLHGDAVPEVFGIHPTPSSGDSWERGDVHARAVVLNRVFGWAAPMARVAFAIRHRRSLGDWRRVLRFVADRTRPVSDPSTFEQRQGLS